MMPTKIMAIAAHPGDALFTMGAAVAMQIHSGGSGVFLNLSLGERGHQSIGPAEYGEMQRAATQKAANLLDAEAEFLSYSDAEIPYNDEAVLAVCDAIRKHRPQIVITHWKGSWHKDHRNTFEIVQDAIFYAALPSFSRPQEAHAVERVFFAENWEDEKGFEADTFLDITPVFEKWMQACALFPMWRGETGLIRYNDYYRSLATMRGCLAGFDHAVALMSAPDQRVQRVRSL
jgi:LmbE family N-acetylglucosaminyl deacetylase